MLNRINQLQSGGNRFARLGRMLVKAFGLVFAFAGAISLASEIRSGQEMTLVTGKIFDVREKETGGATYIPVIEFITQDGRVVHFQGASTRFKPVQGAPVGVLYDKFKPEAARIDSLFQRWLLPGVSTLIGFLLIIGAGFWRR